jgi:DNA-binding response OmpR family regulator
MRDRKRRARTVLVVDDDRAYRAMMAQALEALRVDVLEARDGYQGVGLLSRRWRDLALLIVDTEMPGLHGWDVIRYARMKAPRLRVLRLSCTQDRLPGVAYEGLHSLPTLAKPFSLPALVAALPPTIRLPGAPGPRPVRSHS